MGFGYSNIFVTSPSPENLHTLFDFVFDALNYEEHLDYELIQSTNPEFNKAVVRVNIFHDHRQTIQYIHPGNNNHLITITHNHNHNHNHSHKITKSQNHNHNHKIIKPQNHDHNY